MTDEEPTKKTDTTTKTKRGFASMTPGVQKAIAAKGGRAAHAKGTAHTWDAGEAKKAGERGGATVVQKLGREHMAAIGRIGGKARGAKARATPERESE
jgi:uncharacterized protein